MGRYGREACYLFVASRPGRSVRRGLFHAPIRVGLPRSQSQKNEQKSLSFTDCTNEAWEVGVEMLLLWGSPGPVDKTLVTTETTSSSSSGIEGSVNISLGNPAKHTMGSWLATTDGARQGHRHLSKSSLNRNTLRSYEITLSKDSEREEGTTPLLSPREAYKGRRGALSGLWSYDSVC